MFKVTEPDYATFTPTVSAFKLGKLEKVTTCATDPCLIKIELRDDFKLDAEEEA